MNINILPKYSLTNATPRTLELFVESLLTKTLCITNSRNAKTLSPSHMKQCIMSESRFDFLRELVRNVPDINVEEQLHQTFAGAGHGGSMSDPDENPSSTPPLPTPPVVVSYAPMLNQDPRSAHHGVSSVSAVRNGAHKRPAAAIPTAHPQYYETGGRPTSSMMHKQQSLDLSLSTGPKSCTTPANYYTEIKSEDSDSDIRPPKIARLHSAPVGAPTVTTPVPFALPPVINFDFSKGVPTTFVPQYPQQIACQSPIVNIDLSQGLATSSTTVQQQQYVPRVPRIKVTVPRSGVPLITPPVYSGASANSDAWKPLVKIDYSHLDLTTPTTSSSSSPPAASSPRLTGVRPAKEQTKAPRGRPPKHRPATATTTTTTATASYSPAIPPVAHFDLAQPPFRTNKPSTSLPTPFQFPVAGSSSGYPSTSLATKVNGFAAAGSFAASVAVSSSSCLDMDEDYDNI